VFLTVMTAERGNAMENARGWKSRHRLSHPLWVDPDRSAGNAFRVRAFPTNLVIDKKGIVRYAQSGFDIHGIDRTVKAHL
jgi:hypothetical protein